MNLSYKEILKLKGTWLIDTSDKNIIKPVFSSTKNKVSVGESTMLTPLFHDTFQKKYEIPTEKQLQEVMEERMSDFLERHAGEIKGLFNDKYFRNGGWNGKMDAITDVEKKYKGEANWIDQDYLQHDVKDSNGFNISLFEKLVNEFL